MIVATPSMARLLLAGVSSFAVPTALAAGTTNVTGVTTTVELPSVLVITKSSNRNEVHYAATVDDACTPVGSKPVRAYWRMLERGPSATEGLSEAEQRVLGLERQEVAAGAIQLALRGMPARSFIVHVTKTDSGRCASWVETPIAGVPAHLRGVFVQQKLFGSVDHVLLTGTGPDGAAVQERVVP